VAFRMLLNQILETFNPGLNAMLAADCVVE
jgi:hypothetical protein